MGVLKSVEPTGFLAFAPAFGGNKLGGCGSADHPKLPARPRMSLVFARLFGSGFAGLGIFGCQSESRAMAANRVVSHGVSNPRIQGRSHVHKLHFTRPAKGSRSGAAGLFTVIRAHSVTPGPRRCDVQARQTRPGAIRHQILIFVWRGAMPGPIDDPKRGVTRCRRPMAPTASDRTEETNGKEALRDRARRTLPGP